MNAIFFAIVAVAFGVAGYRHILAPDGMAPGTSPMEVLGTAAIDGAGGAVTLSIGLVGYLVSTLQGSTETTFYVIAVYFGAVQVKRMRYALWAALSADAAGIAAAVFICNLMCG